MTLIKVNDHIINLDNVTHITLIDEGQLQIHFINGSIITATGKGGTDYIISKIKKFILP